MLQSGVGFRFHLVVYRKQIQNNTYYYEGNEEDIDCLINALGDENKDIRKNVRKIIINKCMQFIDILFYEYIHNDNSIIKQNIVNIFVKQYGKNENYCHAGSLQ